MLDPKIIRDEPEKVRKMLQDRAVEFDFDKMLELDKKRRELIKETDELRKKRNQMSVAIGQAKNLAQTHHHFLQIWVKFQRILMNMNNSRKQ